MIKYHYTLCILLALLVSSCVSIDLVSIDYLQPAKVIFPPEIKTVGIVNNIIARKEKSVINKTDQSHSTESAFQGDGKTATESFAKNIAEANYFDKVIICDSVLRGNDLFPREQQELSQEEVRQLTSDLGVNVIFSVEDVTIKTIEKTDFINNLFRSTIDAKISPIVKVYAPSRSKPFIATAPEDSIFWEGYGITPEDAKNDLIKEDSLMKEVSEFAGELPTKYLLPTWKSENRIYYISGSLELRDGGVLVREGSWDDALKLWLIANNKKSDKIKMRTAFNIALYYETHDEIDKAIEWAKKAFQIVNSKENKEKSPQSTESEAPKNYSQDYLIIANYLMQLTQRKEDIQILDLQMKRFNDNN